MLRPPVAYERIERRPEGLAPNDGDVPRGADAQRIALLYNTMLAGLSVQARDGISVHAMNAAIDDAMAMWDVVAAPKAVNSAG